MAVGLTLFCVALTFVLGQDLNFDQLNYHLVGSGDLLRGTSDHEFALGQRQSWLNPLPNAIGYVIVTGLAPRVAGLALALLAVPALLVCWLLIRRVIGPRDGAGWGAALAAMALALTGCQIPVLVGTTYNESWMPALTLGGLLACMNGIARTGPARDRAMALGGFLAGVAAGLKITNLPFSAGCGAALVVLLALRQLSFRAVAVFALALLAGGVVSGGWWLLRVWQGYGDPLFPVFAQALHSPWLPVIEMPHLDRRLDLVELVRDPLALALGRSAEVTSSVLPARDARPLVLVGALLLLAGTYAVRLGRGRAVAAERVFLVCSVLIAYLGWWAVFNIDRYMTPGYLLAGLFLVLAVDELAPPRWRAGLVLGLAALVLAGSHPIRTARGDWAGSWYGLAVPADMARPGTLFVLSGWGPLGWIVAERRQFGPGARFVRIDGNLPLSPADRLGQRMAGEIARAEAAHRPLRSLATEEGAADLAESYARFGLAERGDCRRIPAKPGPLRSCLLVPLGAAPR